MTPEQARHLAHSKECAAAAEAATDPADKAVYRLLQKAYEQLSGDGRPLSTKLLHRDLDALKADTAAALTAAANPPPPPPPPAAAGRYFAVASDGRAEPLPRAFTEPARQCENTTPWSRPKVPALDF